MKSLLLDLLGHQLVIFEGVLYLSMLGSGQGQILSGDLSDNTFYELCEKTFAAQASFQQLHGVHFYARYRDDICIVATPGTGIISFVNRMRYLCSHVYQLECECVSSSHVDFLDVTFFKPRSFSNTGLIGFRPYVKPSANKVPLHPNSAQPSAIHKAWPIAEISRIRKHSSCEAIFDSAKSDLLEQWHRHYMSATCRSVEELTFNRLPFKSKVDNPALMFWIVIPFLKGFNYSPIKSALTKVLGLWSKVLWRILRTEPSFRLSFKNASPSVEASLLAFSRVKKGVERSGGRR